MLTALPLASAEQLFPENTVDDPVRTTVLSKENVRYGHVPLRLAMVPVFVTDDLATDTAMASRVPSSWWTALAPNRSPTMICAQLSPLNEVAPLVCTTVPLMVSVSVGQLPLTAVTVPVTVTVGGRADT